MGNLELQGPQPGLGPALSQRPGRIFESNSTSLKFDLGTCSTEISMGPVRHSQAPVGRMSVDNIGL